MLLQRGMVLVTTVKDASEACIVWGPYERRPGWFTAVHGWVDNPPDCGFFEIPSLRYWRRATPEEAAQVRALFLEHAQAWGPDSHGWVAKDIPDDEGAA